MNRFEDELKSSLRRVDPPADFTRRVIARLDELPPRKPGWAQAMLSLFKLPKLRWVLATATLACVLVAVGVIHYRSQEREKAAGEIAGQRVMLALQIASSKLNGALKQIEHIDRRRASDRSRIVKHPERL